MDLDVTGRVYVVTGGSAGLGLATAEVLVAEGARVVLSSRDERRVRDAVEHLGGAGSAHGVVGDLADPDLASGLVRAAQEVYGRLDGALLSSGGPPGSTAMETSDEAWRAGFESVFLGVVRAATTVIEGLDEGGSVVLVLSSTVHSPIAGLAVSNGLRPGLAMLTKNLADEVGPRGVRVNAVLPGRIATGRIAELDAHRSAEELDRARSTIPMGRYGEPSEVGRLAAFLLSPAASYVTGTAVAVDGGAARTV